MSERSAAVAVLAQKNRVDVRWPCPPPVHGAHLRRIYGES
jgi:hypothetical protein